MSREAKLIDFFVLSATAPFELKSKQYIVVEWDYNFYSSKYIKKYLTVSVCVSTCQTLTNLTPQTKKNTPRFLKITQAVIRNAIPIQQNNQPFMIASSYGHKKRNYQKEILGIAINVKSTDKQPKS